MTTPANDPRDASTDNGGGLPPKRSGSTLWLLLLLALLLLGWLWFSQRGGLSDVQEPTPSTAPSGPTTDATASEKAAEQARKQSDAAKAKPRKPSKPATPRMTEAHPIASRSAQPAYPREAQRRGQAGRVLLRVDVAADGTASNVDFVQRSGSAELDRAAMNAVRKWQFTPARRDGKAVASSVNVPIDYVLPRAD